jgi:hypothetical protein
VCPRPLVLSRGLGAHNWVKIGPCSCLVPPFIARVSVLNVISLFDTVLEVQCNIFLNLEELSGMERIL